MTQANQTPHRAYKHRAFLPSWASRLTRLIRSFAKFLRKNFNYRFEGLSLKKDSGLPLVGKASFAAFLSLRACLSSSACRRC